MWFEHWNCLSRVVHPSRCEESHGDPRLCSVHSSLFLSLFAHLSFVCSEKWMWSTINVSSINSRINSNLGKASRELIYLLVAQFTLIVRSLTSAEWKNKQMHSQLHEINCLFVIRQRRCSFDQPLEIELFSESSSVFNRCSCQLNRWSMATERMLPNIDFTLVCEEWSLVFNTHRREIRSSRSTDLSVRERRETQRSIGIRAE